jgi:hypothetical protein
MKMLKSRMTGRRIQKLTRKQTLKKVLNYLDLAREYLYQIDNVQYNKLTPIADAIYKEVQQ